MMNRIFRILFVAQNGKSDSIHSAFVLYVNLLKL